MGVHIRMKLVVLICCITSAAGYLFRPFSPLLLNFNKAQRVTRSEKQWALPCSSSSFHANPVVQAVDRATELFNRNIGGLEPLSIYYTNFDITGGRPMETTMLVGNGSTLSAKLKELNLTEEQREQVKKELVTTSIIDAPTELLEMAYLSSLAWDNIQSLLNTTLIDHRSELIRGVPIHFLVRGSGGGKTRGLEECRIPIILGFKDWLVMSTTFGYECFSLEYNYSHITLNEETKDDQEKCRCALSLASSLVIRMLQTFYGFPRKLVIRPVIQDIVRNITESWELTCVEAVRALLHGTVKHMVLRISEKNPAKTITKFTLMMDETMKFFDKIPNDQALGVVSILSNALLDERVWINETYSVGTSLVISSLSARICCPLETESSWE